MTGQPKTLTYKTYWWTNRHNLQLMDPSAKSETLSSTYDGPFIILETSYVVQMPLSTMATSTLLVENKKIPTMIIVNPQQNVKY